MQNNRTHELLLGKQQSQQLSELNVLLIGVGGIGCEVLKVLCKYTLKSLHILDLDTIEVSNLNRQFLFRKEHRGMYKSHVAKERLLQDYPNMNIISYNDNIKDDKFGIKFFQQFQLVIMALDNTETRSYVNRICMTLDIPILDAGTTGYKGQAFLINKAKTRCYDCFPRDTAQKVYPACTIRTLPEKPVHCVIWAKYLFGVLFGPSDDSSNMLEDLRDSLIQSESQEEKDIEKLSLKLVDELYFTSIKKQIETNDDEEVSEKFKHLKPISKDQYQNNLKKENQYLNNDLQFLKNVHDLQDYIEIFRDTYVALSKQKIKDSIVQFEKDDPIIIKFVNAACNLRCHVFNIPFQNEFQVKQISGNIIPAIASTNAIVAAIEISETIKYLAAKIENRTIKSKELFVQNDKCNKILPATMEKPNKNCFVCQPNILPDIVFCNFEQTTFKQFLDQVVLKEKQLEDFSVSKDANLFYEYNEYLEEDEIEANEKKLNTKLVDIFGVGDSKINVTNEDSGNVFRLYILVHNQEQQDIQVKKQIEGEREEVNLNLIMKEQGVNLKGEEELEQEKQEKLKNVNKINNNTLEIVDSDEEIEMIPNNNNKNEEQQQGIKRRFSEIEINEDIKGVHPDKKIKPDTQIPLYPENTNGNQQQVEEEDDEIIIL